MGWNLGHIIWQGNGLRLEKSVYSFISFNLSEKKQPE